MPDFAITSFSLVRRTGTEELSGRSYEDTWNVRFTGAYDARLILTHAASGYPRVRTLASFDSGVICDRMSCDVAEDSAYGPDNTDGLAKVQVRWVPVTFDRLRRATHPLLRDPVLQGGGTDLTFVSLKDQDGQLMVNSSGELYSGLPPQFVQGVDFTMTLNQATNPLPLAANYSNTMNNAAWYSVAQHAGFLGKIAFQGVIESFEDEEVEYWQVSFPVRVRADTWLWKPIDVGRKKTGGVWIMDPMSKRPIDEPVPLNGSGNVLTGTTPVVYPTEGYKVIKPANWGTMSLPNPFTL